MIQHDAIFTNVAVTADNQPWWEGLPAASRSPTGRAAPYDAKQRPGRASELALHGVGEADARASRRTPKIRRACRSPRSCSAAAAATLVPLVFEARDWTHGVLVGAAMGSETTAAATGAVGVLRRDSMAMKPFCGYNFADYFAHWLVVRQARREAAEDLPRQLVPQGRPTASSCGRASATTCACCDGSSSAATAASTADETPIGYLPKPGDLDIEGLACRRRARRAARGRSRAMARRDGQHRRILRRSFGERVPKELHAEHQKIVRALS